MRKPQPRQKGDIFRPIVTVLKAKSGIATKISFNGVEYVLNNHGNFIKHKKL